MRTCLAVLAALFLWSGAAQATPIAFGAILTGPAEAPPNASPGTGVATVIFDADTHLLKIDALFSGLVGNTTAAHIHCCTALPGTGTAGVATQTPSFIGFPLGVRAGTFSNTYDLRLASSWNPAFITAQGGLVNAEANFVTALFGERTYFNIHTNVFPGGEIRGFLVQTPEPASLVLLGTGLVGAGVRRWRKRRTNA